MDNRIFSQVDQDLFSSLSGDYNPQHIDPIASRRLLYGSQVVHGIHILFWSLNQWAKNNKREKLKLII